MINSCLKPGHKLSTLLLLYSVLTNDVIKSLHGELSHLTVYVLIFVMVFRSKWSRFLPKAVLFILVIFTTCFLDGLMRLCRNEC